LRATLDWSCGLLTGQEQRLFERLSVFAGGWTLDAAEAVCAGDDIQPDEVLDLLARLVDKSLVVCQRGEDGSVRYTLLETLRQYASERLRAAGREGDRIACHHAAYFLAQAEEHVGQPPWQADTRSWFERLDREHDNYRVALAWSSRIADHRTTLRLATALTPFWDARGHLSEGQRWLEEALVFGAAGTTHERAWGLVAAADLALKRAEYGRATALFEEGLVLLQNLGERAKAARVLNGLGIIAMRQGDYPRALCRHEQALALAGELGETISQAWALSNMGFALGEQGDWERATPLLQESLKLHSERGFSDGIAVALTNLGAAARAAGDHQRALTLIDESLSLARAHGLRSRIAIGLLQLGRTRHAMGEVDRADVLVSESLGLAQEVGELACVTECLEELGYLAEGCHQAVRAATLLGAAAALREAVGSPLPPAARAEHDRCLASVQAKLGSARFEAAWQSGQRMPVANVVRTR
jgi:tetratricopeptide (TPR) repeat protein